MIFEKHSFLTGLCKSGLLSGFFGFQCAAVGAEGVCPLRTCVEQKWFGRSRRDGTRFRGSLTNGLQNHETSQRNSCSLKEEVSGEDYLKEEVSRDYLSNYSGDYLSKKRFRGIN